MAEFQLNTNIPLMTRVPDTTATASSAFNLGQQVKQAPLRNELLQGQAEQQQQNIAIQQAKIAQDEKDRVLGSIAQGAQEVLPDLEAGDFQGALNTLYARQERLRREGKDTSDTDTAIQAIESKDAEAINRIKRQGQTAIDVAESRGLIDTSSGSALSAEGRSFENLIKDFTPKEKVRARKARAGIIAKAGDSSTERIARDKALSDQVAEVESKKAESRTLGKIKGEAKGAPLVAKAKSEIAKSVTLATKEAAARGEALSNLKKAEAGLPGLEEVVVKLKDLSSVATFTKLGSGFNAIAKEFGFGATKGATARASYQGIIDNQVLPLLKQTFGAAMTEGEGKRLADTLGDVNATPEEKQAQLDAFIDSQRRQIENLNREVAPPQQTGGQLMIDANGNRAIVFPDGTIQEVQ